MVVARLEPGSDTAPPARDDAELIAATAPFLQEQPLRTWGHVFASFAAFGLAAAANVFAPWLAVRIAAGVVLALMFVRVFILYHDVMHGALLRNSPVGRALFYVWGVFTLTPPGAWNDSHNHHHARTGRIRGMHIGSWETVTTDKWRKMRGWDRFRYRLVRHPLTIVFGYLTVFLAGMCVSAFLRRPARNWDSLLTLVVHVAGAATVTWFLGWEGLLVNWLLPFMLACAFGAYLFYAQHNYPGATVYDEDRPWSYAKGALTSSSYMHTGPIMRWVTGNIGYHHVHHLNPTIPFYRLPELMAAIPELQVEPATSLRPRDVIAALSLKLWDAERGRLVGWREGAAARSAEPA